MAMISCRECGASVSSKSRTCPRCGVTTPSAGTHTANQVAMIGCLGLPLLVILGFCVNTANRSGSPARAAPTLRASVERSAIDIRVTNRDSYAWTNCRITINGGLTSGYRQDVGRINAGQTVAGGLMFFTDGGERFNPVTHAVERVSVFCDTPEGRGSYFASP